MSRWWKKFKVKASNTVEGVKRKALYKKQKRRVGGKEVDEEMVMRGDPVIYQAYKKRFGKDKDKKIFKDSGWRKKE